MTIYCSAQNRRLFHRCSECADRNRGYLCEDDGEPNEDGYYDWLDKELDLGDEEEVPEEEVPEGGDDTEEIEF